MCDSDLVEVPAPRVQGRVLTDCEREVIETRAWGAKRVALDSVVLDKSEHGAVTGSRIAHARYPPSSFPPCQTSLCAEDAAVPRHAGVDVAELDGAIPVM